MPDFNIVVNDNGFEAVPIDGSDIISVTTVEPDVETQMQEAIAKADGYGKINKILHALKDAQKNVYDINIELGKENVTNQADSTNS